jgi:hypothetical protein
MLFPPRVDAASDECWKHCILGKLSQAPIKQSIVTLGSVPDLQAFSSPCSDVVRRPQPTVTFKLIALTFKGLLMG